MAEIDFNALGQAFDTTWGRSSTPKSSSCSVKFDLNGPDVLTAKYVSLVNFVPGREAVMTRRRCSEESVSAINTVVAAVKKRYKSLTGKGITLKEIGSDDSLETISMSPHTPKRTAYYRRNVRFELG